ncbi:antiterminator Q family protein [Pseudomonas segetis]|uniref:Phage antitermination protein Q n=1 Tax=Pseudomonas segetis TaxID=298908 RepID=A0A239C897_9PSED|nr:antiterminator Q family protein [Pseudomonas segetis]SNS16102.1 Phage antitermination protein Q [Pseudomonas segetis]
MQQIDTAYLLQEWGVWLRVQVGVPRYVSPSYALMRDNVQMSGGLDPCITDDTAMLIDRLVSRLEKRYPEAGQALWNYYRHGISYRHLGKLMGITHVKAQELVMVGSAWVDSALCGHDIAA